MTERALRAAMARLVRRGLAGVWIRGPLPAGPLVWAANHHSWWDPFVAYAVLREAGSRGAVLIDQASLERYRFTERIGAFGTRQAARGLDLLRRGRALVVFPEGRMRPPGAVDRCAPGAAWYARRGAVPLIAAATRVVMRGGQWPEAYVTTASIDTGGDADQVDARLAERLNAALLEMDTAVGACGPRSPVPGYRRIVTGRRSWEERVDRWRERTPR